MLETRGPDDRVGLIKLLMELTAANDSAKLKIGGCVGRLVEIIGSGMENEQIAAADALAVLIDGSKRNATAAIRAQVGDLFVKMLATNENSKAAKSVTQELLAKLTALKSTDATATVKKLVKTLTITAVAVADPEVRGVTAFELLDQLLSKATFAKTFIDAGAVLVCTEALKPCVSETTPELATRAAALLSKVSQTKHVAKLIECGAVDVLTTLLKATPPGSPLATTTTKTLASLGVTVN